MLLSASLVWPCCMEVRDSALNARRWPVSLLGRESRNVENCGGEGWQRPMPGNWAGKGLVGDMRHFCEGELALIVLNKEKIRFNFFQTQHRRPTPSGRNLFPSSPSSPSCRLFLSSVIVLYKPDIINQTLAHLIHLIYRRQRSIAGQ